jgi:hypothetical protein
MIDPSHIWLSIVKQCSLMSVSRSSFYYQGKGESPFNLKLMRLIDEQWLKTPFFGSRRMAKHLRGEGYNASRKRVRRLMRKMGIAGHLSQAQDHQAAKGKPGLSLSSAESGHRPPQSGLVQRYHLSAHVSTVF